MEDHRGSSARPSMISAKLGFLWPTPFQASSGAMRRAWLLSSSRLRTSRLGGSDPGNDWDAIADELWCAADLSEEIRRFAVERPRGLIAEQDIGLLANSARDGHALLLASRHLLMEMIRPGREPDQVERCLCGHRISGDLDHQIDVLRANPSFLADIEFGHDGCVPGC